LPGGDARRPGRVGTRGASSLRSTRRLRGRERSAKSRPKRSTRSELVENDRPVGASRTDRPITRKPEREVPSGSRLVISSVAIERPSVPVYAGEPDRPSRPGRALRADSGARWRSVDPAQAPPTPHELSEAHRAIRQRRPGCGGASVSRLFVKQSREGFPLPVVGCHRRAVD
jgi:hypothetical protein